MDIVRLHGYEGGGDSVPDLGGVFVFQVREKRIKGSMRINFGRKRVPVYLWTRMVIVSCQVGYACF